MKTLPSLLVVLRETPILPCVSGCSMVQLNHSYAQKMAVACSLSVQEVIAAPQ